MGNQTEPGGVNAGVTANAPADVPEAAAKALSFDSFYSASYPWVVKVAIAAALECRPGTVKSLAARGLARLRKEIEE